MRNGVFTRLAAVAICLLALAGLSPVVGVTGALPADAAPSIQGDRDVEFVSGGVTFKASYRGPVAGSSGVPAAVIIGGTGNLDRNGTAPGLETDVYRYMADRLSALGVASIRYDKLGTGATGLGPYAGDPSAMLGISYDQLRVQPARDAMAFLAAQPGIDAGRLIVIGHSEGGLIAMAIDRDPKNAPPPAGLALVEPGYAPILDGFGRQISDQIQQGVQAGVIAPADATTLVSWMHDGIDQIRAGTPPYPAPGPVPLPGATGVTADAQEGIRSNVYGSDPLALPLAKALRTRYGKEVDEIDPVLLAPAVRVPTLVTCGTKDFNTPCVPGGPPGSGVVAFAATFAPGVADLVVLPDTVHLLRDVGNDDPDIPDQINYPFSTAFASAFDAYFATFLPAPTTTTSTTTTTSPSASAAVATPTFTG